MDILFVKKLYSPVGGSETLTYHWAHKLAVRGHNVRVLSLWPVRRRHNFPPHDQPVTVNRYYQHFKEGGVSVYQLAPRWGHVGKLLDILPFFQLIRGDLARRLASGCEIVHDVCREYTSTAQAIAREQHVPLVLTPLPHPGQPFSGASSTDIKTYREADGIVAMTEHEKRWYESLGVVGEKVSVVGAGAAAADDGDATQFRARYGIRGPMVLFVGRQESYKGYLALAAAASTVWAEHPKTHFVFIGEKSWSSIFYDPLMRYRDRRIVDLKVVGEQDKASAYAACDIFCMPSTHETLGLTYLEAWSYGKPVIGGDIAPLHDVICHEEDGLLVKQRAEDIAGAIKFLLDQPSIAMEMGAAGRRKLEAKYSWPAVTGKLEQFYAQLLRSRGVVSRR